MMVINNTSAGALLKTKGKNNAERHSTRSMQESTSDPETLLKRFNLFCRDRLPHPNLRHGSSHYGGDLADLFHQPVELIGEERLWAVGQSLIRLVMHFHE